MTTPYSAPAGSLIMPSPLPFLLMVSNVPNVSVYHAFAAGAASAFASLDAPGALELASPLLDASPSVARTASDATAAIAMVDPSSRSNRFHFSDAPAVGLFHRMSDQEPNANQTQTQSDPSDEMPAGLPQEVRDHRGIGRTRLQVGNECATQSGSRGSRCTIGTSRAGRRNREWLNEIVRPRGKPWAVVSPLQGQGLMAGNASMSNT